MMLDCPPYNAKIRPKDWPNLTKFTNCVSPISMQTLYTEHYVQAIDFLLALERRFGNEPVFDS